MHVLQYTAAVLRHSLMHLSAPHGATKQLATLIAVHSRSVAVYVLQCCSVAVQCCSRSVAVYVMRYTPGLGRAWDQWRHPALRHMPALQSLCAALRSLCTALQLRSSPYAK